MQISHNLSEGGMSRWEMPTGDVIEREKKSLCFSDVNNLRLEVLTFGPTEAAGSLCSGGETKSLRQEGDK